MSERRRKVRQELLEQSAVTAGEQWAQSWCDDLHEEGRRLSGGWPGTLTEARARARAHCASELRRRGLTALTTEELEQVTRATYASARSNWLSHTGRER